MTVINEAVTTDLQKRKVNVAGFLVQNEDGHFQLICYNQDGTVQFITEFVEAIDVNEKLNGSMIRPMASMGKKK